MANGSREMFRKAGGTEEPDGEVEEPVRAGSEGHARGVAFRAPKLRRRGTQAMGRQGDGVDRHQEIAERDDGFRGRASHLDLDAEIPVEAVRKRRAVRTHDAADDEQADSHADGLGDEEGPATTVTSMKEKVAAVPMKWRIGCRRR